MPGKKATKKKESSDISYDKEYDSAEEYDVDSESIVDEIDDEYGTDDGSEGEQYDDVEVEADYIDGEPNCTYNKIAETEISGDFDDDDLELDAEDKGITYIDDDRRISTKYLTSFERTRIIGDRAKQIELGAKPMVKVGPDDKLSSVEIALIELQMGVLPYILERKLPDGIVEKWKVSELELKKYD